MEKNKILFVVYTPYIGYLPKRMRELEMKAKMNGVDQIIVTPDDYESKLKGLRSDTVHLIELHPDTGIEFRRHVEYFEKLSHINELIEAIKVHNTM